MFFDNPRLSDGKAYVKYTKVVIKIDLVKGCAALVRCFWVTNLVTTFWSILPTFFWRILGKPVTRLPLLYLPYQLVVKWLDFLSKRQNICGRYLMLNSDKL